MAYRILHPSTGKVVNLYSTNPSAPVADGTRLLLYSWQDNNDQKWNIEYIGSSVLLRLLRDTGKVMNRHSNNNNAHVWTYRNDTETNNDSLVDTETTGGNTRIKLVARGLYLTKNSGDNYLSWAGKIDDARQYFKIEEVSGGGGTTDGYQWPTTSTRVTIRFSEGHPGWDIGAVTRGVEGDPIYAMCAGRVTRRFNWDPSQGTDGNASMGNCLFIQGNNPKPNVGGTYLRAIYMHMLSNMQVGVGTNVSKGQLIGYMGDTGRSFGAHLHLGLQANSTNLGPDGTDRYLDYDWVNPSNYFNY